jgi:ribonucleoside-triphosphate reductase
MVKVIKRDGREVDFDSSKILVAIQKANREVEEIDKISETDFDEIVADVIDDCKSIRRAIGVEEIQDFVEEELVDGGYVEVARKYIRYRYNRELIRKSNTTDETILSLINQENEELKQENSNKNPVVLSTQRDYMAGEVSKDLTRRILLSEEIVKAHDEGIIHFHDMDYFAQHSYNCCLINLKDMLQNGTMISETRIDTPHSFATACNIATQIIAQVASNQYGGQTISLAHLAPFVEVSRKKIRQEVEEEMDKILNSVGESQDLQHEELIDELVEKRVRKEVARGVQTIQYQINTLLTTNGQAPFLSEFMYLNEAKNEQEKKDLALVIEETLLQRIQGVKNARGEWITPAFPKLLYVLEEDNITENSPFWYLTELAAKCTAKRMVPDYISEKIMLRDKVDKNGNGNVYGCMGCRSFLTPYVDENGNPKYYGRFNQGVVTINLPDVGLSANKDLDKFWSILDERLELCHRALQARHQRLEGTVSDVAPILWQNGAIARLKSGEKIDELLHGGYSTISLGYAGLWECVYSLNGKKLTEKEGKELGIQILKKLNEYTSKWKKEENIDYSLYGTPIESTTYKFAKSLQKRFGLIEGVSDKNYITNSYHVHVDEPIDAFSKLAIESELQPLSPGGCISYIEVPNLQKNIPAVLEVIKYIYGHIMYAELNTKSDNCQICGFEGEIQMIEDENRKLVWECPNCGNRDFNKMNVARRVCGYISTNAMNQGRMAEIKDRVVHLGME